MKTCLNLLLFFLFSGTTNAQITNSVYLDYSSLWHYHSAGWNGVFSFETFTTTYIDGDTTVNGQAYYKQYRYVHTITYSTPVNSTYTLYGPSLLREDASNNFVYYYNGSESLFLDNATIASAAVSDPFPAIGANCNVENVVTRSIGAQNLQHLYGPINMNEAGIMEGVGYVGPTCALGVEGNEILVCYYKLGDSLCIASGYEYSDFPEPLYMNVGTEEFEISAFNVYPNPTNEILTIRNLQDGDSFEWLIYDASGKEIVGGYSLTHARVNVFNWNTGIYFVQITDSKGNRITQKVVVE